MTDKQIIIEDCPYFIGGNCQEYLDGVCENHKCDLKIIRELEEKLSSKEQECEELKEAQKNSRCAWKSLEGTFCPQAQEQLEAYKMEADEGKEINAELKAENEEYKKANDCILTTLNVIAEGNKKLRQILTEIKEIAEHCIKQDICTTCDNSDKCHIEDEEIPTYDVCKLILQKISEVEDG